MTQQQALDILKMGHNVFLTGPAGSGKTHLLNQYIKYLNKHNVSVAVTASTGIAATHIDGRTIHSWAAIKTKAQLTKKELDALFRKDDVRARIAAAKVLIIDEVSMLDAKRFELIDTVCRRMRQKSGPFGGLQVILCGDFFQLPPISTRGEPSSEFVFASTLWERARIVVCYLEKQYRQSDVQFLQLLNDIRGNLVTEATRNTLRTRHQKQIVGFPKPTKLYTHNHKVDSTNSFELSQIDAEPHAYYMSNSGDKELVTELKKSCIAPEELVLKTGAFVMFVKNNFDAGYVNGTLGTVVGFDEENGQPIVEKRDGTRITVGSENWIAANDHGTELARISQVPLRLAWAITVHKSQGMSLDCAEIDLSQAFIEGMGYVALSRVRTLSGIKLMGLNDMALRVNPLITEFDKELKEHSHNTEAELGALTASKKQSAFESFLEK